VADGVRQRAALVARPALARLLEWRRWERPLEFGSLVAAVLGTLIIAANSHGFGVDMGGIWRIDPFHPYRIGDYGAPSAFFYSPVFALIAAPFGVLPWPVFRFAVLVFDLLALRWLLGRWAGYALLIPAVMNDLIGVNVDLPLTAAVVISFQRPALWAAVLLTKVTPVVGALWFVARREWRAVAEVIGVTLALGALSVAIAPDAWVAWITLLVDNVSRDPGPVAFPIPLWIRLPIAAVLAIVAGWTNRPWLIPIAAFLGIAVIWRPHFTILLGVPAMWMRSPSWQRRWQAYVDRSAAAR
jgi:hypothetical protein